MIWVARLFAGIQPRALPSTSRAKSSRLRHPDRTPANRPHPRHKNFFFSSTTPPPPPPPHKTPPPPHRGAAPPDPHKREKIFPPARKIPRAKKNFFPTLRRF